MMKAVWPKGLQNEKNVTAAFQLKLTGLTGNIRMRVAAENLYRVHAFNAFAGYGPARAAHGFTRVDTYDLTPFVRDGALIITAEVVGNNVNSYYTADDLPFFAAEVTGDGKLLADAGDFQAYLVIDRVRKVQRYSFQRHFVESYRMRRDRGAFYNGAVSDFPAAEVEIVSGNRLLERVSAYPLYPDADAGEAVGGGSVREDVTRKKFADRSLTQVGPEYHFKGYRYEELEDRVSDEASAFVLEEDGSTGNPVQNGYRLYDFGQDRTGFFGLRVSVKRRAFVYVLWDEILIDPQKKLLNFARMKTCNVVKWELEPGEYSLLSFEAYTMRYAQVVVKGGPAEIGRVYLKRYENANAGRLRLTCADPALASILEAARSTFAQNAVDILTDCPSRERAGWLCDTYFSSQAERLFTGHNEIEHNFLENYQLAPQDPDLPAGMIPMCYPSDNPNGNYIPNWAMWFVLELKGYLARTGNRALVDACRDKVKGLIRFFTKYENEFGLLEHLEQWVFIEWSRSNEFVQDVNFPSNMLYCGMLDAAAALYGDTALSDKAAKLRKTIRKWSFNGEFFADNAVRENGVLKVTQNTTETCQYYAFYFGVASRETDQELFDTLVRHFGARRDASSVYPTVFKSNAFIGNYLRLDWLRRAGLVKKSVNQCRDYFGFMAEHTGTLWEHDTTRASCNHGFASYVANILVEGLTGYVAADQIRKTVLLRRPQCGIDCEAAVPIGNSFLHISVKDGRRTVTPPDGYRVENLPENE